MDSRQPADEVIELRETEARCNSLGSTAIWPQHGERELSWYDALAWLEEQVVVLERDMSVRALEQAIGLSHGFLSRVLRRRDYKSPSPDLTRRVAQALGLPPDFFPEAREDFVCERVRRDPKLREQLYDQLRGSRRR